MKTPVQPRRPLPSPTAFNLNPVNLPTARAELKRLHRELQWCAAEIERLRAQLRKT